MDENLKKVYNLLHSDGNELNMKFLNVDAIDYCTFGNSKPFRIKITGRTKNFINAFGEELIIENAEKALEKTLLQYKLNIVEYTVAPFFMNKENSGFHQWLIEFKKPPKDFMKFKTSLLKFSGFSIFDMWPTPGNIIFLEVGILDSNILPTSIILLPRLVPFSNSPISITIAFKNFI